MSGKRILVVEDEPKIMTPLIDALKDKNLDPSEAATISEARDAYRNNTFDAIIETEINKNERTYMNVRCLNIFLFYYSVTIAPKLFQYRPVARESVHVLLLPPVLLP